MTVWLLKFVQKMKSVYLYQLPSQSQHNFENFITNFNTLINLTNIELPTTEDVNARYLKWCNKDHTNFVGCEIDTLTASAGSNQSNPYCKQLILFY